MVGWAMEMIGPSDAIGWFRHCGFINQLP